jgi:hypothetical protein
MIAALLISGVLVHLFASPVRRAQAIAGCNSPFTFTGGEQTCVIPSGFSSMTITAVGADGAQGGGGGGTGGLADEVEATFPIGTGTFTSGQTLFVEVGGASAAGGSGFNGGGTGGAAVFPGGGNLGGGGGGASDVRTRPFVAGLSTDTRFIIAAGGGGGGGRSLGAGGAGGDAINAITATPTMPGSGSPGFPPPPAAMAGPPGGGGGAWGGSGFPGGLGGIGGDNSSPPCTSGILAGCNGTLGQGGNGGPAGTGVNAGGGGGGGGGYVGGGGGGGGAGTLTFGGSGGGGGGAGFDFVIGGSGVTFASSISAASVTIVFNTTPTPTPTATATATATVAPTLIPNPIEQLCTGLVPCQLGLPLPPISPGLVAPYIGYSVIQSCYTGGYCPGVTTTPPPVPTCVNQQNIGSYQTQPDGSQVWVAQPVQPGIRLCPSSVTPTPSS